MRQRQTLKKAASTGEQNTDGIQSVVTSGLLYGPVLIFGKPVAREIIFSNHKGVYKKRVEKRQRRLLMKIPFINPFLEEGEIILLVTSGYAPLTKLERFLLRYLTVFQRRALFVFTDRRLIYIPTTFTYGYRYSLAEVRYASCKSIQVNRSSLVLELSSGVIERFPYINRKERRKIEAVIAKVPLGEGPKRATSMTYLCARCGAAILNNSDCCPKCRLRFRIPGKAGLMALLIPGGGYFYIGNTLYGFGSAILELIVDVLLIWSLFDLRQGFKGSVWAATVCGLVLIGIKIVSFYHVRGLLQGCFPVRKDLPLLSTPSIQARPPA